MYAGNFHQKISAVNNITVEESHLSMIRKLYQLFMRVHSMLTIATFVRVLCCLSICLSVCLSAYVHLFVSSVYVCLSLSLSVCSFLCLFMSLPCLSFFLFMSSSVCSSGLATTILKPLYRDISRSIIFVDCLFTCLFVSPSFSMHNHAAEIMSKRSIHS